MKRVALIAGAIAVADQLTKWLVLRFVDESLPIAVVNGFLQIVHWRNTGAAWGLFRGSNLPLTIFSVLTLAALVVFRRSLGIPRLWPSVAIGLISGGIIGNVVDRIRLGSVVDFLDFYVGRYHWPAFNIADSAICVGVVLYIIVSWRMADEHEPGPAPAPR